MYGHILNRKTEINDFRCNREGLKRNVEIWYVNDFEDCKREYACLHQQ